MLENGFFRLRVPKGESDIVTLRVLFVYNPELVPKMQKPLEEDIQDAKLLYYYPKTDHQDQKRNTVGLAEGLTVT
jgi:hypothetical protein